DFSPEFFREFAVDGGDIDPHFFEYPSFHDGHLAAAAALLRGLRAGPGFTLEFSRRTAAQLVFCGQLFFKLLKCLTNMIAQLAEPGACAFLFGGEYVGCE